MLIPGIPKMIKAILVDDELSSLESLQIELNNFCPQVEIVKSCHGAEEALQWLLENSIDLVFLDIEMPGMSGFELLQQLPNHDFYVIFVTAYDEFALRAFDFNAIDYLLKPIRKIKLQKAVEKVEQRAAPKLSNQNLQAIMQNINLQQPHPTRLQKIALPNAEGYKMVLVEEISHFIAESNYTWVHLINGEKLLLSKTLKDFEVLLKETPFFRSHKSYLVNLHHIDKYVRGQGGYLVTTNGDQFPVARSQKTELIKILKGRM